MRRSAHSLYDPFDKLNQASFSRTETKISVHPELVEGFDGLKSARLRAWVRLKNIDRMTGWTG